MPVCTRLAGCPTRSVSAVGVPEVRAEAQGAQIQGTQMYTHKYYNDLTDDDDDDDDDDDENTF